MKLLSSVPKLHFEKYGVSVPDGWDTVFIDHKIRIDDAKNNPDTDVLLTSSDEAVSGEIMDQMPGLKMIHTEGSGYDKIDVEAARARGIYVCNNRAANNLSVAEHTIGLILTSMRRIPQNCAQYKALGFTEAKRLYHTQGEFELAGKTVGLIGFGAIGREVARRLAGWSCDIAYYDPFRPSGEVEKQFGVRYMELDEMCRQADILSLHVPVLPSTINILDARRIAMMKSGALLINTGRGELLDNNALAGALEEGRICAALDVISPEPTPADHVLLNLSDRASERLIITTHIAGMTDEAFRRMLTRVVENMRKIEASETPENNVYK